MTSTESEIELANVNTEGTKLEDNTTIDTLEVTSPESTEDTILESKKETTETPEVKNKKQSRSDMVLSVCILNAS